MTLARAAIHAVERGWLPDPLTRWGIRRLCRTRLAESVRADSESAQILAEAFLAGMRAAPVALLPERANAQHYEVPAAFFEAVLGPRRKYSCAHWGDGVSTLAEAEASALELTCQHAGLADGQDILELGCGWGSLTLWMAERFPRARITAVSNSTSQRAFIEARAAERGFANVQVLTADMNDFQAGARYDRVVSVEMFEHLRNWPAMLSRIAGWLNPGGQFFMHVFCHRDAAYLFEDRGEDDWMSRNFFSGGMMPSAHLPARCQDDLVLVRQWQWDGRHYQRTANAWLAAMDARRETVWPILVATYGAGEAGLWWQRWRLFFLAVAETFGYGGGQVWGVVHVLYRTRGRS